MTESIQHGGKLLELVLESGASPAITLTSWIAKEIDPKAASAVDLIVDPATGLECLRTCKDAFKHLTLEGETTDDRTIGAVCYAASIAAALANHRARISRQSSHALEHAFRNIWIDESADLRLRDVAWRAFMALRLGLDSPAPPQH
jgi:hypothetical protein